MPLQGVAQRVPFAHFKSFYVRGTLFKNTCVRPCLAPHQLEMKILGLYISEDFESTQYKATSWEIPGETNACTTMWMYVQTRMCVACGGCCTGRGKVPTNGIRTSHGPTVGHGSVIPHCHPGKDPGQRNEEQIVRTHQVPYQLRMNNSSAI